MGIYRHAPKVTATAYEGGALGVNAAGKLTDLDLGKAVKRGTVDNWVLCAVDNDIEGVLRSAEANTVNNGFGYGTVQTGERVEAINAGGASIAVLAEVIAAAQPAVGTALPVTNKVQLTPVKAGTGTLFKWRVISLMGGNGGIGTRILIEKI